MESSDGGPEELTGRKVDGRPQGTAELLPLRSERGALGGGMWDS